MIRGRLSEGPSWLDGAPTLVLDYSETSRSRTRQSRRDPPGWPGLFLGLMYDRTTTPPRLSMYFAFRPPNNPNADEATRRRPVSIWTRAVDRRYRSAHTSQLPT